MPVALNQSRSGVPMDLVTAGQCGSLGPVLLDCGAATGTPLMLTYAL